MSKVKRSRKEKPTRTALKEINIGTGGNTPLAALAIGLLIASLFIILLEIIGN